MAYCSSSRLNLGLITDEFSYDLFVALSLGLYDQPFYQVRLRLRFFRLDSVAMRSSVGKVSKVRASSRPEDRTFVPSK